MEKNYPAPLPGDRTLPEKVARMIRVNHAGEYGAVRIYQGQLATLRDPQARTVVTHMLEQEKPHLAAFDALLRERRVQPTLLSPLWHVGGYALGAVTGALGTRAAMACTEAVEAVIDQHYAAQETELPDSEADLRRTIAAFRADEAAHHDTAIAEGAHNTALHPVLYHGISMITRAAIWLSTRA